MTVSKLGMVAPWIMCVNCKQPINNINNDFFTDYFLNKRGTCPSCQNTFDIWQQALFTIEENFMHINAMALIGAMQTFFSLLVKANEAAAIKFSDYGIPSDAKVLRVNYTANASLIPLEMHTDHLVNRNIYSDIVYLFPAQIPGDEKVTEGNISVFITWILPSDDDELWETLIDAFEHYMRQTYNSIVIPANVVVESKLLRVIDNIFVKIAGKKNTENFLPDVATYGHQLNTILPFILWKTNLPNLKSHIRGLLNKLRKIRNFSAHDRMVKDKSLKKKEAAELLCAVLFGFHYLRFIERELEKHFDINKMEVK